jgi:CO dehydrogenase maturation factor
MKIAFVGKGGSGKTTVSAVVSRFIASKKLPVLALDADINQHLGCALGMSEQEAAQIPAMGIETGRIKEYLRGNNPLIPDNASMIKTTPPGRGSNLISMPKNDADKNGKNPIYNYFSRMVDGIRFMAVGPFDESDLGVKCYHSKTGSVELLLNHMVDGRHEYAIVDMTAGSDSFASGLFTRFDVTFLIVEPTLRSVAVYRQYKEYAKNHDVLIRVIGNKIKNDADADFLKKHIGNDMVAAISQSAFIEKMDRAEITSFSELEPINMKAIEKIVDFIDLQKKDWPKFYRDMLEFHIKNAESWANGETGKNLQNQIDPSFSFQAFAA